MNKIIRKTVAYLVLVIVSFLCLFWFYALFINATRSNGELARGFSLIPGTAMIKNWNSMLTCALPVMNSMKNSLFISLSPYLHHSFAAIFQ